MYVRYNNNTHAMLKVNALLESPMQGLHYESLWRACCMGQHCVLIHTIVRKSLVKYCKTLTKRLPRRERVIRSLELNFGNGFKWLQFSQSLKRCRFNHNIVGRRLHCNKVLSSKFTTQSIRLTIYACPMMTCIPYNKSKTSWVSDVC